MLISVINMTEILVEVLCLLKVRGFIHLALLMVVKVLKVNVNSINIICYKS